MELKTKQTLSLVHNESFPLLLDAMESHSHLTHVDSYYHRGAQRGIQLFCPSRSRTGLLQRAHGAIMCRQTKAEAASKSLMQNLCSCGCFSGWKKKKNQYCGRDARRWLSALWLTVKAERDWGAPFTALEMEWSCSNSLAHPTFEYHCGLFW